jgi:CRISPR-associated protein Cas1
VVSVIGDGAVYDPVLREAQLAAQNNGAGLRISTKLIQDKVANSCDTLRSLPASPAIDAALDKLELMWVACAGCTQRTSMSCGWWRPQAAYAYFAAWQMLPLRWKGTVRKPIPPEWRHVVARPSMVSGRNRHATHPVNAMLSYAYAVLESQVRFASVSCGLDPTIGYLHACRPGRVALVYDLMEPIRPRVDRLLLDFVLSHTFPRTI